MAEEQLKENTSPEEPEQTEEEVHELKRIRMEKLEKLKAEGKNPFEITSFDYNIKNAEIRKQYSELEAKLTAQCGDDAEALKAALDENRINVKIAGRIMTWRNMGKANFIDVRDSTDRMQVYVRMNDIGEEQFKEFKTWDMGDIVGVEGFVFKTRTGEITVHAQKITLLSKSLLPLPEKWHGLKDQDTRYRQRYVDLIVNPEVAETFRKRSKIIAAIRRYLDAQGFIEVETPMLVANAGGASARPFETHYNALDEDVRLRISLELYLKRLIVGGLDRVYEIGRVFRIECVDTKHNPEFTLMELYQAYTDYHGMMDLAENLYRHCALEVCGTTKITYGGVEIDLGKPFERLTMVEAVKKYSGVDFEAINTIEEARAAADAHHIEYEQRHKKGDILNLFFDEFVEEHLVQPTFIMDHPVDISPLTKKKPDKPEYTERFELFITGREMANAYSELNDPVDQRQRFEAQEEMKRLGDEEANSIDEDFLRALEIGMPPTGGSGFGIDRLVMLLTDSSAIRDVLLFPTMKSLDGVNKKNDVNNTASEAPEKNVKTESEKIDFSKVKVEPSFEEFVDFDTFSKSDFRAVKVKECVAVPKSKKLLQFTLDDGTGTDRTILSGIHSFYEPEELVGKTLIAITNLPPRAMMGIDSCGMLLSAIHEEEGEEKLHLLMVDDHIPAGAKLY